MCILPLPPATTESMQTTQMNDFLLSIFSNVFIGARLFSLSAIHSPLLLIESQSKNTKYKAIATYLAATFSTGNHFYDYLI